MMASLAAPSPTSTYSMVSPVMEQKGKSKAAWPLPVARAALSARTMGGHAARPTKPAPVFAMAKRSTYSETRHRICRRLASSDSQGQARQVSSPIEPPSVVRRTARKRRGCEGRERDRDCRAPGRSVRSEALLQLANDRDSSSLGRVQQPNLRGKVATIEAAHRHRERTAGGGSLGC